MSDIVDNSLEHAGKFRSRKTGEYCREDDPYAIPADEYQTYLDKYDNVTDGVAALNCNKIYILFVIGIIR